MLRKDLRAVHGKLDGSLDVSGCHLVSMESQAPYPESGPIVEDVSGCLLVSMESLRLGAAEAKVG